ncbi:MULTISPECIES: hypothetical protein [Niastella]|uniref:DUF4138 domain-containing protein n=1 Tax=Niastella soli TaxID=2821487 RepID=A0ABS3YNC2_9BACT|nr:hypothetical protein [Niastella soli]MBO9199386.1 hypothetical protein [Niastella soli]
MKQIFLYLLLLATVTVFAQKNTQLKINIKADSSRLDKLYRLMPDTISFYTLPENKLALEVPEELIKRSFEISNIAVGTYLVKYRNMFRQPMTRQVTLTEKNTNEIFLCVDSLDNYPQNTLSRLKDKESVVLNVCATYCGGFDSSHLVITRKRDHFSAEEYRVYREFIYDKGMVEDEPGTRAVVLNEQQIEEFVRFENELPQLNNTKSEKFGDDGRVMVVTYTCTTTERYSIKSKYFNFEKTDDDCRWKGFSHLLISFFGSLR